MFEPILDWNGLLIGCCQREVRGHHIYDEEWVLVKAHLLKRTHQPQWGSPDPRHSAQESYCWQDSTGRRVTCENAEILFTQVELVTCRNNRRIHRNTPTRLALSLKVEKQLLHFVTFLKLFHLKTVKRQVSICLWCNWDLCVCSARLIQQQFESKAGSGSECVSQNALQRTENEWGLWAVTWLSVTHWEPSAERTGQTPGFVWLWKRVSCSVPRVDARDDTCSWPNLEFSWVFTSTLSHVLLRKVPLSLRDI